MAYEVKFVGKLQFTARTPVHVGGAREANVLYALRLRSLGRLLVPSSTWKGAFRAIAEKLAPSMPLSEIEKLAVERVALSSEPKSSVKDLLEGFGRALRGEEAPPFKPDDVKRVLLSIGYSEEELRAPEDPAWMLVEYLAYHCPIGKLFGNQVRAGSVRFLDTLLTAQTQRRPGVGISRKDLRVQEGVLYTVETTEAEVSVPLVMVGEVERLGSPSAKLLASTLEAVKEVGLSIGGRKSAGLGLLQLESAEFHVVKLAEDKGGVGLANPLKTPMLSLENFMRLLRS
ncbi:MAG: RAMP superfamily CRISPR-associated protein [Thermofilaceae archaeon]